MAKTKRTAAKTVKKAATKKVAKAKKVAGATARKTKAKAKRVVATAKKKTAAKAKTIRKRVVDVAVKLEHGAEEVVATIGSALSSLVK